MIIDILRELCAEQQWAFLEHESGTDLLVRFEGENGAWSCLLSAREEQQQALVRSVLPSVGEAARGAVMIAITRINAELIAGGFDLDLDSGALSFRTSIDVEGDRLTPALARQLVLVNLATTDAYLPVLQEAAAAE
ncbi:YbjN domain-containing protein [Kitasatospora viridis]|uniref:Sensory transduction regulator n=1 Tax=Kitasatospora viridis TaxID=281105 RepID=A0A561UCZ5_9ACTN|nr:YbjN domain-containing protein [Kitasatospora viridis]TWF97227.1 hypothetical protein FHX73_111007 [Kitasatospora viridis]